MLPTITPSYAYGCLRLVSIVEGRRISRSAASQINLGHVEASEILNFAISLKWLEVQADNNLKLSQRGIQCLGLRFVTDRLSLLLGDYIRLCNSPWVQLIRHGRKEVLINAPKPIIQLFHEANLAESTEDDVVTFWDEMSAFVRSEQDQRLNAIGRVGEKLSLEFEEQRVGKRPKWTALEGNNFGYDVLSQISSTDDQPLKIEVKCSEKPISNAEFFLTRHEWSTALQSTNYVFHVWSIHGGANNLAVIETNRLQKHLPQDTGLGSWVDSSVPFSLGEDLFREFSRQ